VRASYDPFGQPIDPATDAIGALAADDAIPNTSPGARSDSYRPNDAYPGTINRIVLHPNTQQ
jgi:hypothetical protein